ncbi:MAG: metallophosphoesterase family protein [Polyangiaceae bacterium]|nr:metallophosphoesterase family protein [Polyangiaceae bacterium]
MRLKGGASRIVLVADTHSQPHPDSARRIADQKPDYILHAGDIGDLSVLDGLSTLAPVLAVRGNIDSHAPEVPDAMIVDVVDDEGRTLLKMLLVHIAVYGPKIRAEIARLAEEEGASLVLCGHSHVPFIGRDKGLVVFNPGSIGPRRFQLPIVFGVVDITPSGVKLQHVDCETGERWTP